MFCNKLCFLLYIFVLIVVKIKCVNFDNMSDIFNKLNFTINNTNVTTNDTYCTIKNTNVIISDTGNKTDEDLRISVYIDKEKLEWIRTWTCSFLLGSDFPYFASHG